jgi:hypothetical protein
MDVQGGFLKTISRVDVQGVSTTSIMDVHVQGVFPPSTQGVIRLSTSLSTVFVNAGLSGIRLVRYRIEKNAYAGTSLVPE